MTSSALSLLGLALRGSNLAVGEEPVKEACQTRRARLVLTAADAAEGSADRARRWAEGGDIPWVQISCAKEELGSALGRSTCAMAALTDQGLAGAFAKKLAEADPQYRPLAEQLALEKPQRSQMTKKKKSRAETKKPAVPET